VNGGVNGGGDGGAGGGVGGGGDGDGDGEASKAPAPAAMPRLVHTTASTDTPAIKPIDLVLSPPKSPKENQSIFLSHD